MDTNFCYWMTTEYRDHGFREETQMFCGADPLPSVGRNHRPSKRRSRQPAGPSILNNPVEIPSSHLADDPSANISVHQWFLSGRYRRKGAITSATTDISLSRMFSDGPEVSLNGSPTVSPTTAAL